MLDTAASDELARAKLDAERLRGDALVQRSRVIAEACREAERLSVALRRQAEAVLSDAQRTAEEWLAEVDEERDRVLAEAEAIAAEWLAEVDAERERILAAARHEAAGIGERARRHHARLAAMAAPPPAEPDTEEPDTDAVDEPPQPSGGALVVVGGAHPPARSSHERRWSLGARTAAVALTAAAVVVSVLGLRLQDDQGRANRADAQLISDDEAAYDAARRQAGSRTVVLDAGDGDGGPRVPAVLVDGGGWVDADALPRLEAGRTYQLWANDGRRLVSLGILGYDPGVRAFQTAGDVAVRGLAITEEPDAGSRTPGETMVVTATVG